MCTPPLFAPLQRMAELTPFLLNSNEELVIFRHALSRPRCNGHSLLLSSYLFRIVRIENPSCSTCGNPYEDTSHLILHCPATDSLRRSLCGDSVSLRPLVQTLGSCPASGAPWSSAMPPFLGRGPVTTTAFVFSRLGSQPQYY